MTSRSSKKHWTLPFLAINLLYLLAFFVTMYVLIPLQERFTPEFATYASLLFLPHGIRILTAWLYGARAIVFIAPAALFTHWLNFGSTGFSLIGIVGVFSGVTCAALTFWLLARFGLDFSLNSKKTANWRDLMLAGSLASIFNTLGMGFAFNHNIQTLSGYFIGDISGLFACMFILMLAFKMARNS